MQNPIRIAPSILASDFAGADLIHVDVMDGHFVPNLTIGPGVVGALRSHSERPFDVHLMIAPVDGFLADFAAAGADTLTVHPEAGPHTHRSLQLIKSLGKKAGLALNPGTPVEVVDPLLDQLDLICVMSVNPGFGGQKFLPGTLDKIAALRQRIDALDRPIDLEVDGGINFETAPLVIEAGADVLVAGTAVFTGGPEAYGANIRRLRGES
jgi:ribulose-phosphate 3-epimerase